MVAIVAVAQLDLAAGGHASMVTTHCLFSLAIGLDSHNALLWPKINQIETLSAFSAGSSRFSFVNGAALALRSTPLPSHGEILRVGVEDDDGAGGLFGVELVFVRERHADAFGVEEAEEKNLVLEVRAGGVAEGVA